MATIAPVSKKAKAALLNQVLRIYEINEVNETSAYSSDISYMYDDANLKFQLNAKQPAAGSNKDFTPITTKAKKTFDDYIAATKYAYQWSATTQRDHFLEVQHVIKMLIKSGTLADDKWGNYRLVSFLHLSYFMNDKRNVWRIPAGLNQVKKHISLQMWYPGNVVWKNKKLADNIVLAEKNFIREYLFGYTTGLGMTPFTELFDLASEMSTLPPSDLTCLTIAAGTEILNMLQQQIKTNVPELSYRAITIQNIKNTNQDISDMMGRTKGAYSNKRKQLSDAAAKGETMFVSGQDKIYMGPSEKKPKNYSFNDATEQAGLEDEESYEFTEDDYYQYS